MVTINLLRRTLANEQRRRRRCQVEGTVGLLLIVGAVVVCGLIWLDLDRSLAQLHSQEEQQTTSFLELERLRGQLEVMKHQTADLMERSHQVTHLTVQHRRSIQLLDVVSRSLDPLKLWLAGLEMEQEQVKLMGFAESKDQIVQFAQFLKQDELFHDVAVLEAGRSPGESSAYHFIMNLLLSTESGDVTSS